MINPDIAARIKACNGVYSIRDTANYFNVSKDTVHRIWTGRAHTNVSPASEPANIKSSRVPAEVIIEDGRTLLQRGLSVSQVAERLGVSKTTVYDRLKEIGVQPCYFY